MTVISTVTEVTAAGNGATTIFSFSPVKIFASSHLLVKRIDAGGDETTLVEGTHYSVNIPASMYPATGSISYPLAGVPLPSGESLLMRRVTPILQGTDLENQGGYAPETQEETFDYGRLIDQELDRRIDALESTVEGQDTIFISGGTTADAISYDDDGNTMLTGVDDVQEAIDAADLLFASQASGLALKADKSITLSVVAPLTGGGNLASNPTAFGLETGATAGDYVIPDVTLDAYGRVLGASATVREVNTTSPLNGGGRLNADRTIGMDTVSGVAGSYAALAATVDVYGRVTAASEADISSLPWVDVTDYGATGDGSTDDRAAVLAAIAALPVRGVLYFPIGVYALSDEIEIQEPCVTVVGDGPEATELRFTGGSDGLKLTYASEILARRYQGHVRGLSLTTAQADGGSALVIQGVGTSCNFSVHDVVIRSTTQYTGDTTYWTNGIEIIRAAFITLWDVTLNGRAGNPLGGSGNSQSGIKWTGIDSGGAFNLAFDALRITNWKYGIKMASGVEGIYGSNNEIWECEYGIYIDRSTISYDGMSGSNSGVFFLNNTHLNAGRDCIFISHMREIHIQADVYHGCINPNYAGLDGTMLYMTDCTSVNISGCKIENAHGAAMVNGVVLNNCLDFTVVGNFVVRASNATGIWLSGTSSRGIVANNIVDGGGATSTGIFASSGVTAVTLTKNRLQSLSTPFSTSTTAVALGVRGCLVYPTADFSQNNGTVSWGAEVYDTDGIWSSGATLTVPAGVSTVRISAQVATLADGSGDGVVTMNIRKNSASNYPGEGRSNTYANSLAGPFILNASTAILQVSPGDTFDVFVGVATGNWRADRCWAQMEIFD